jgi:hypothetical protein
MQHHYDAMMRMTVDLPEDLHRIVSSLAQHTGRSRSAMAVELMLRGLEASSTGHREAPGTVSRAAATGLPTVHLARPVTPDDVKAVEDEP